VDCCETGWPRQPRKSTTGSPTWCGWARRIDTYRQDTILRRDIQGRAPRKSGFERKAEARSQPPSSASRWRPPSHSKQQLAYNLQELRPDGAEDLQLDHSLVVVSTVYSQLLLIGSKDVDSDRAERSAAVISRDEGFGAAGPGGVAERVYNGGLDAADRAASPRKAAVAQDGRGAERLDWRKPAGTVAVNW